jgi:3-phenylpropionate/trans-cinnamate dioxygenase ferredoxin subunit
MRKFVVAPAAEIPPGARRRVDVEGRAVVVFNVDGRFYGLRDVCPHRGALLSEGVVIGGALSASEPGRYEYDSTRRLVKCPWHGWEFDLETGQSWVDPARSRVRPYAVAIESGQSVSAALDRTGDPASGSAGEPGPYVAETVSVAVEEDYVVIVVDTAASKTHRTAEVSTKEVLE